MLNSAPPSVSVASAFGALILCFYKGLLGGLLKIRGGTLSLPGARPCLYSLLGMHLSFPLLTLRSLVPMRLTTRGAMGSNSSSQANPLNLSPRPLSSDFPLSQSSPAKAPSCCCFYPKPFLVSLSPTLIIVLSKNKILAHTFTLIHLEPELIRDKRASVQFHSCPEKPC